MWPRDTSWADLGLPTEQKGNVPQLGPSPGPGTFGQVRKTYMFLFAPTDFPWALGKPLASRASASSSVKWAPVPSSPIGWWQGSSEVKGVRTLGWV